MRPDGTNLVVLFGVLALWVIVLAVVVTGIVLLVRYMRKRSRVQDEMLKELRRRNDR